METSIFIALVIVVRATLQGVEEFVNRPASAPSLCEFCAFAHAEMRVNGRRDLFCTVGGRLRKMRGVVSFCSSFHAREAKPARGTVGFVQIENRQPLPGN
jgi:hypothetical protein